MINSQPLESEEAAMLSFIEKIIFLAVVAVAVAAGIA